MNRLLLKLIYVIVASGLFSPAILGCSHRISPINGFNNEEYIFAGKVVGYTDAVEFKLKQSDQKYEDLDRFGLKGHGVVVEVLEMIHSPLTARLTYEVFRFNTEGDCSRTGKRIEDVKKEYPLNSNVIVIGEKPTLVSDISENKVSRLEIRPVTGRFEVSFSDKKKELENAADFSKYFIGSDDFSYVFSYLLLFEIKKDLLKLKQAAKLEDKEASLNRLLSIPHDRHIIDIYKILLDNLPTQKEAEDRFIKKLRLEGWHENRIRTIIKCNQDKYGSKPRRNHPIIC